jgi:hypothetical protein
MKYTAAIAAITLLSALAPARAALIISGDVGGSTFTCVDNDVSCDTNATTGIIQIADQTINGVVVNGSIQTSTKGSVNVLDTSSLSIINNNATATAITFTVGDTDFVGPATSFVSSGSGTFSGPTGSTITLNWFDDPNNVQGGQSAGDTPGILVDTFSATQTLARSQSFSHNDIGPVDDPTNFSMTLQATGTLQPGAQLLSRGQTETKEQVAIREPASLAMLGGALLTMGFFWRRRRE